MAFATETTVTVKFDPNTASQQSDVISPATEFNAGVMTAQQVADLEKLKKGQIVTLDFTGTQPLDGNFPYKDVTWPVAYSSAAVYAIFLSLQTSSPVQVWEKVGSRTENGTRILAADQFTGTVEVKGELK